MTVIRLRVCEMPVRRLVQVSVVTALTAFAPLNAVPAETLVVGAEVPFHVQVSVCVPGVSDGESVKVSRTTTIVDTATGRAVHTFVLIPVAEVRSGHSRRRS